MSPATIPKEYYKVGVERMIKEGLEYVTKIQTYLSENELKLKSLDRISRKKAVVDDRDDFKTFVQVHPIVFEYLVTEGLFNERAFKEYIKAAFGSPKSAADQELISKDKRNVYFLKNKQYALYYKYLIRESNPHLSIREINASYDEMVSELNNNTAQMLDAYEEEQKKMQITERQLTDEKKKELVQFIKDRLNEEALKC